MTAKIKTIRRRKGWPKWAKWYEGEDDEYQGHIGFLHSKKPIPMSEIDSYAGAMITNVICIDALKGIKPGIKSLRRIV